MPLIIWGIVIAASAVGGVLLHEKARNIVEPATEKKSNAKLALITAGVTAAAVLVAKKKGFI